MAIEIVRRDLLKAEVDVIAHQVNCMGVMGAGVARQIRDACPSAYQSYRAYVCSYGPNGRDKMLGRTLLCPKPSNEDWPFGYVAHLFGQYGYGRYPKCYTDYRALRRCFASLAIGMRQMGLSSVAMPYKIGCGLAGGDWENLVYPMIVEMLGSMDVVLCRLE